MREIASFIVRVYRRDADRISGVVEDVESGCIHSFHSAIDLWVALIARAQRIPNERNPK